MAKNYEVSVSFFDKRDLSFFTHRHNFDIQNALISKPKTVLSWKIVNRYKFRTSMPDEDKNFSGFEHLMTSRTQTLNGTLRLSRSVMMQASFLQSVNFFFP